MKEPRPEGALVSLRGVTKKFPGVTALDEVELTLTAGETHILLGENGAGKSTLINILIGDLQPDTGEITVRGRRVSGLTPQDSRAHGINAVLQDFSLSPALSVTENLFLGREQCRLGFLDRRGMRRAANQQRAILGPGISVDAKVESLARADQQLVEIAKATMGIAGVLLLDEPTSAITESESRRLFEVVARLKAEGWAILYITHRMEEVRQLGDRVTVLRDGRHISTRPLSDVPDDVLLKEMVGRNVSQLYPAKSNEVGSEVFRISGLAAIGAGVREVSMSARCGEIVGVAGLVGCGKERLGSLIVGDTPRDSGTVAVAGRSIRAGSPRAALRAGIGIMPSDRKVQALALNRSLAENITMEVLGDRPFKRGGLTDRKRLKQFAHERAVHVNVRPVDVERDVGTLSGGNQQKVVLARALTRTRQVYVVSEPTAGVDIGAKQEIYAHIRRMCNSGAAVVLISSDLEEIVGMADRVYVMKDGRISAEVCGSEVTPERIIAASFGSQARQDIVI